MPHNDAIATDAARCEELLKSLFLEYCSNNEHIECLHELFISFVADYRRDEETHKKVLCTYTSLRTLLVEAGKIFEAQRGTQPH